MLEKPALPDEKISTCLRDEYGLRADAIAFLPLGTDQNTAVYRAVAQDGTPYFVKLRRSVFNETSVALPKFLNDQGVKHIIAPLATKTGKLAASKDAFNLILYPWVERRDGYEVSLSDQHWRDLGAALKRIHTTVVPVALARNIQQETYSHEWREIVKTFVARVENESFDEPIAAQLAAFLKSIRRDVLDLVERADRLAWMLLAQPPETVVCHSDVHARNVLIDSAGALFIIDWDDPIFSPKERDLMFAGGGQFGNSRTPREEETLFYQGYGETQVDPVALAYYRYERIVEDIAVFCEKIFLTSEGGRDRERSLRHLQENFLPNNTIEIACKSDRTG